ncbi:HAMP domain-containing histidine kinase [bacterium]|nr:HAMP domain-containing histidine kinase [bacterium]
MKLKVKLTCILLVMGLLPIFVGYYAIHNKIKQDLELSVVLQFQDISRTLEHSIDNILNDHKESLTFLSSLPSFQEQLLEDWDKDSILRNLLSLFLKNNPLVEEIFVTKGQNDQIRFFSSTHAKRTTLKVLQKTSNLLHQNLSTSFLIEYSKLHQSKVIKTHMNFEGQDGEKHLIQASIKLNRLFQAIKVLHRHKYENISHRKIIMLDHHKNILFSNHPNLKEQISSSITKSMLSINSNLGSLRLDGQKYLYHKAIIPQIQWEILILKEYDLAFSSLNTIKKYTLSLLLILAILIILLGNVLARIIVKPIDQLIYLSEQIALGNHDVIEKIERQDEIGVLAQSMNHMAESIDQHQQHESQLKSQLQESLDNMESTINSRTNIYLKLVEEHQSLSTMLSHDMGNYLTNISLKFEDLAQYLKPQEMNEIHQLNQEAHNFLKKVLEFCSVNEGLLKISFEKILLYDFIEDIQTLFSNKLDQKSLKLDIKKVSQDLSIYVDREWFLFSVLNNIISNSIKFSHNHSTIFIESSIVDNEIILSILDQGVGMDSQKLESIFEGGKKISTAGTKGETGSGFGLKLVKKWIEKFHGHLEIESRNDNSQPFTKVSIHLPLTK